MTDREQRHQDLGEDSRLLVTYLRKANALAGALRYPEAVWTLSEAVGNVVHPTGFATQDEQLAFCRAENARAQPKRAASREDGQRFRKALEKARDLAETMNDTKVTALIDAAGAFHAPLDRFSRSLTEGVFNMFARDDRHDPSTSVTGTAFNASSRDSRTALMAKQAATAGMGAPGA